MLNFIKGIACIGVVFIHVGFPGKFGLIIAKLCQFAVPIFAMTANTFAEDIAKARDAGMDGHIAKPVDMNALMQTLRRAMQG